MIGTSRRRRTTSSFHRWGPKAHRSGACSFPPSGGADAALGLGGAAVGHVAGRTVAKREEAKRDAKTPEAEPQIESLPPVTQQVSFAAVGPGSVVPASQGAEPTVYRLPLP